MPFNGRQSTEAHFTDARLSGQHVQMPEGRVVITEQGGNEMRVMLTGGTGFLGGHVLKALVAAGHEPTALVRSEAKLEQVKGIHGLSGAAVGVVVGDILDAASVAKAMEGADACIHSAAFTTLDPAAQHKCVEVNAPGTRIVLDAAVAAGCDPIIHMSSMSCIFPPVGDLADPYIDPVHSTEAPYARSKADSEHYARELQAAGRPVTIVYPAGVTGPDDAGFNVMSMVLTGVVGAEFLMSAPSGGWSLVDVRDLATAIAAMVARGKGPRRYMAGGNTVDWAEFNRVITDVTGRERAVYPMTREQLLENLDEEAVDIMLGLKPSNEAPLRADTGVRWRPIDETVRDTVTWLMAHGHLDRAWAPALSR